MSLPKRIEINQSRRSINLGVGHGKMWFDVERKDAPLGFGWTTRGRVSVSHNTDTMAKVQAALDADKRGCASCERGYGPAHARTYVTTEAVYTSTCRSGSRWYNPATGQMEGRAHCTCEESCF